MNTKKLQEMLATAMTVGELKGMLDCFKDEDVVVFARNSGDYWNTEVATTIDEIDHGKVKWSDYHSKLQTIDRDSEDDSDDETEGQVGVIIIR